MPAAILDPPLPTTQCCLDSCRAEGGAVSHSSGVPVLLVPAHVQVQGLGADAALDFLQGLHEIAEADISHL